VGHYHKFKVILDKAGFKVREVVDWVVSWNFGFGGMCI
jgi:hypothetical protein